MSRFAVVWAHSNFCILPYNFWRDVWTLFTVVWIASSFSSFRFISSSVLWRPSAMFKAVKISSSASCSSTSSGKLTSTLFGFFLHPVKCSTVIHTAGGNECNHFLVIDTHKISSKVGGNGNGSLRTTVGNSWRTYNYRASKVDSKKNRIVREASCSAIIACVWLIKRNHRN